MRVGLGAGVVGGGAVVVVDVVVVDVVVDDVVVAAAGGMNVVRVGSGRRRVRGGCSVLRGWRIGRVVVGGGGGEGVVRGVGVGCRMGFWSVKERAGDLVRCRVGERARHFLAL